VEVVVLGIRCSPSGGGIYCDMGEFHAPVALVATAYAIGFLGLAFGIYLVARGRFANGALLRRIGQGRPVRLIGLSVVMASALMLVSARAFDLVNRHIQPPAAFELIQIAATPLVLGAILGLHWYEGRSSRPGRPPTTSGSAAQP